MIQPSKGQAKKAGKSKVVVKPTRRSHLSLLIATLVVLAAIFFWLGGLGRISNSMAHYALRAKQLERADWWLSNANFVAASDARSEYLRAQSARQQGNFDLMATRLKAAFDKGYDPQSLDREQMLALASLGQLNEQVEARIQNWMLEPDADIADILDAYSNGLTTTSRFAEANALFATWEEAIPTDPLPNYRRGRIEEHLSRFELAAADYRKAIEKDPDHFRARYSLARLLNLERQPAEALEYYRSCNFGDYAPAAKIGMAQCYKALGDAEEGRRLLKEVIALDAMIIDRSFQAVNEKPERHMAASELGCIETELGNFAEAKTYLEMALEAFPKDSIARYSYAVALRGLGMQEESEDNFEKTRESRAALDEITLLKEKLRQDDQDTESRIKIGKIILQHESERAGVYWFESVFAYDPKNQDAHQALVQYYESKLAENPKYLQLVEYHRAFLSK